MRLYKIPAGTNAEVIQQGKSWEPHNFKKHKTKFDNFFEVSDIVFDTLLSQRVQLPFLQQRLAKFGFWAFKRDGYVLIVHGSRVSLEG